MKKIAVLWIVLSITLTACEPQNSSQADLLNAEMLARVEQLEQEVERLQDVRDIKKLQRAFGYYQSQHRWNDIANLFAEDGELKFVEELFQGKEKILAGLKNLSGGEEGIQFGELDEHMILQPVIQLSNDGRSASGRWRALIWWGRFEERAEWRAGIIENEYIEINGVWHIQRSHWIPTFAADYQEGWAAQKTTM